MSTPSLIFYFAPGASSMAAHIALHEVGAPFEARPVSFVARATRDEAFRAINPAGQIPVLVIDGRPLTEVAAILFYLARRFPEARLLPEDVEAQAHVIAWMSFVASTLHPLWSAYSAVSDDPTRAPAAKQKAWRAFELADAKLGDRPWAHGEYSIADIHLFRLYFRLRHSVHPQASDFPKLEAHYARIIERPAVRRTCELEAAVGYEIKGFTPPEWR